MVLSLLQWLDDHPSSTLQLPWSLRRRSPQAPNGDAGRDISSVNANAGNGIPSGTKPDTAHVPAPQPTQNSSAQSIQSQERTSPQSMDVDVQPQAPSHDPAVGSWQFFGTTVHAASQSPPLEQSPAMDSVPPGDTSRADRPTYAAAVANSGRPATHSPPNVTALSEILTRTQDVLRAVVQATPAQSAAHGAPATLAALSARAEPILRELMAVHAGLAAAQALQGAPLSVAQAPRGALWTNRPPRTPTLHGRRVAASFWTRQTMQLGVARPIFRSWARLCPPPCAMHFHRCRSARWKCCAAPPRAATVRSCLRPCPTLCCNRPVHSPPCPSLACDGLFRPSAKPLQHQHPGRPTSGRELSDATVSS